MVRQIRQAMRNIIGDRIDDYIDSVGATTQAVVYGIGLTALAQAILAGMGYALPTLPTPFYSHSSPLWWHSSPLARPLHGAVWRCGYYRKDIPPKALDLAYGEF